MKCGVRFCGGCNPNYERGQAFRDIQACCPGIDFANATEEDSYDILLVIGGCSSCCASYEQFKAEKILKMWDISHKDRICRELNHRLQLHCPTK